MSIAFEKWWNEEGQYLRAGGGDYEKTFAYHAWMKAVEQAVNICQAEIDEQLIDTDPWESAKSCLDTIRLQLEK